MVNPPDVRFARWLRPVSDGGCDLAMWEGRLDNTRDLCRAYPAAHAATGEWARVLYERQGVAGLRELIGDWSVVLADHRLGRFVLASDYACGRPLYYHVAADGVRWSTDLEALAAVTKADDFEERYFAGFIGCFGYPNLTPYRGVQSVPPGEAICLDGRSRVRESFWSEAAIGSVRYSNEHAYDEHLRSLFREAVAVRLAEPRPAIAELSGGLDSSSVVAMACELIHSSAVAATRLGTVSYLHASSLDAPFVAEVERTYGLRGLHLSTDEVPLFSHTEGVGSTPADASPLQRVAAGFARSLGAGAFLTGQGGDLVFGNWIDDSGRVGGALRRGQLGAACVEAYRWSRATQVPVAHILVRALATSLPWPCAWGASFELAGGASIGETSLVPAFGKRMAVTNLDALLSTGWMAAPIERRSHFRALAMTRQLGVLHPIRPLRNVGYTHPMLHRPLVEFLMAIPAGVLSGPGDPRRLMRRALGHIWPARLRNRRSKGLFTIPYARAFRPFAARLLTQSAWHVVDRGWVDRASFLSRLKRFSEGLSCNEPQLRQILLLENWLEHRLHAAHDQVVTPLTA